MADHVPDYQFGVCTSYCEYPVYANNGDSTMYYQHKTRFTLLERLRESIFLDSFLLKEYGRDDLIIV